MTNLPHNTLNINIPHHRGHTFHNNLVDMQRYDFFFSHHTFSLKSCVF